MKYPQIFRVRQKFERPRVADVAAAVEAEMTRLELGRKIMPGQSVAIAVGSRGIAEISLIVRAVVEHFKRLNAAPFIVPAMGSHGGATAEGQQRILESYGVTEAFCGCAIRASMETQVIGQAAEGFAIHFDRLAAAADHVFIVGRVKPHTLFVGPIESGLMKMLLIGLGKHEGAKVYHAAIQDFSFDQIVRSVGRQVLEKCRILGGLAVVESAYDELARIATVAPADFERADQELLVAARQWMARLPFDRADVLIIDEIGKNISGVGMDSNVIGRKFSDHAAAADEFPKVRRIVVRGLSAGTHGAALGIGLAEFCRSRVIRQTDRQATWVNALTSGHVSAAMFPLDYETDREILDAALPTIGLTEPQNARLMWIKNTLELAEVECSATYLDEARGRTDLELLTAPRDLPLDAAGNLPDDWGRAAAGRSLQP